MCYQYRHGTQNTHENRLKGIKWRGEGEHNNKKKKTLSTAGEEISLLLRLLFEAMNVVAGHEHKVEVMIR